MKQLSAAERRFQENVTVIGAERILFSRLTQIGTPLYKLSDIAETASGGTPDRNNSGFFGGSTPWLRSGELNEGLIIGTEESITDSGLANSNAKIFPKGTLLIALYGATVGKTGILGIAAATNQAVCAVVPKRKDVRVAYLRWFLRHKRQDFLQNSFGGAQPNISQQILRDTRVPLPASEIQDALTTFLDAVERRTKDYFIPLPELPEVFANQQRAVVRIEELAAKVQVARNLQQECIHQAADLFSIAVSDAITRSGGTRTPLERICSKVTDGEHATPLRSAEQVIPLVTAKNVRDGFIDLRNTDFVSEETAEKCWRRCRPQHNDVLMVCVGATTGRVCRLENPLPMVIVRSVALLRPDSRQIEPGFLEYALESSDCQDQIWSKVKQAAQPCLYIHRMKLLEIPVPSLTEQGRIVAYLNQLQERTDALKGSHAETSSELNTLMPSILDKALQGPL